MPEQNQKTIHPTEILPQDTIVSSKDRGWRGLIFEDTKQQPNKFEAPQITEHLIMLVEKCQFVGKNARQVSRFAGQSFEGAMRPDAIFILPVGTSGFFSWTTLDTCYNLIIEPNFLLQTALETCEANPSRVELVPNAMTHDETIRDLARLLKGELYNPSAGGKLYAESLATAFAAHLLRRHCAFSFAPLYHKGGLSKRNLQLAAEFINEHLSADLSLNALAALCGLSQYHFARQFKQSTGLAPHQYVLRQRIERAKVLLKETDLPFVEIALSIGFGNQSHFSQVFRRVVGASPSAYRLAVK